MRKATLLGVAIFGASMALTASAAEMMRDEHDRYQYQDMNSSQDRYQSQTGRHMTNEQAYKTKYQSHDDRSKHPLFQENGLMQDR